MKSFKNFLIDEYIELDALMYLDRTLFKNIYEGKFLSSDRSLLFEESGNDKESTDSNKFSDVNYMQNDEEVELIKKYHNDPDSRDGIDALNKLYENKVPWIEDKVRSHLAIHPYKSTYYNDLVQMASLALVKAIENFDVNSGNIFNAFAKKYVETALLNAHNPERHKIDKVPTVSIDTPVTGSRGEWADKDTTIGDIIPDQNTKMPWDSDDATEEEQAIYEDWLKTIPEIEAKAMRMYYTKDKADQKTLDEIGKEIGMTKAGVGKLLKRVVKKLEDHVKGMNLK